MLPNNATSTIPTGNTTPHTIHSTSVKSSFIMSLIKSFIIVRVKLKLNSGIPEHVASVTHPLTVLCRAVTLLGSYLTFLDKPHQP